MHRHTSVLIGSVVIRDFSHSGKVMDTDLKECMRPQLVGPILYVSVAGASPVCC